MNNKLNVCVMFGGKSTEHDISIISGLQVYNALNKDKYKDISSYELKNKVITKLLQKGYEYSDIKELIKDFEF